MKALITGVSSQDGSYLIEFLRKKNYEIVGLVRPGGAVNAGVISHLADEITLQEAKITNLEYMKSVLRQVKPDEIYNLAAVSDYSNYIKDPLGSHDVNGNAPLIMMEAIRTTNPGIRFFQAGSAQVFGNPASFPQGETTPFSPVTPYGASKAFAQFMVKQYRETHKLFAASAILFNHESPRRPPTFVTRKISMGVANIAFGKQDSLVMGNLDVKRDWGFAGDYVEAMWEILQHDVPDDYVVGTGKTHTVKDFLEEAFKVAGITDWQKYVQQDPKFMRPETSVLEADPKKITEEVGWQPKVSFKELVRMMVEHDLKLVRSV